MPRIFALSCLVGLALSACGYQQETFAQDYAASTCLLYEQCDILETYAGYDNVQTCKTDLQAHVDPEAGRCPEYDKKLGTECIDAINATTCAQFIDGHWPKTCDNVCPDGSAGFPDGTTGGTTGGTDSGR